MTIFSRMNKKVVSIIWIIAIALSFFAGITIGQGLDLHKELLNDDGSVEIRKLIDLYGKTRSPEVSFGQFWDVWDKVKEHHVDQPVDEVAMFYGAIEGMVAGLDDPYSIYMPPAEADEFAKDLAGEFEGIGAEIGIRDDQLTIIAPLPGSPAEQAGLRPGDTVYAIDGEDAARLTIEEAVIRIRGKKGTTVVLSVSHDGFSEIEDVEIIRDTITISTVYHEMRDNNIAYLRISYFNQDTWSDFDRAVKEILLQSPTAIILDLRSNPGGFLETSVDIASEWVEEGIIVTEGNKDDVRKDFTSRGSHRLHGIPTVVLVDGGSASGSEIVAGALQDHGAATLVGIQTFGKGSVQEFEVLTDGSALKLTVAKWYTPEGREIDKEGIAPDVIVEEMFTEVQNEDGSTSFRDVGLEKALEILNK